MLTKTLVIVAFALAALMVAVLGRVLVARRRGEPMPEGVLLQRITWLVAIAITLALTAGYAYATGWFEPADSLESTQSAPPPPPVTTGEPGSTPTTGTGTGTTTREVAPPPPTAAPGGDAIAGCDPDRTLSAPLSGYSLEPLPPATLAKLQQEFSKAARVTGRTLRNASGQGTLAAQIVAMCPTTPNVTGTRNGVLQAQQATLERTTGETVSETSFTVGRTVVVGRRTQASDRYSGVWAGATTVFLLRDVATAEAEPVLRTIVPRLRQ